jgi:methionine biosynthesis protein MetW
MNKVKKHYEEYWTRDSGAGENYPRNKVLPQFFKVGDFILDVGCGDGEVAEYIKGKMNVRVAGIDISEVAVEKAVKKGVEARVANSEELFPFKDETFDAVFWGDNIEHLFDPIKTGREIKRVLKKNGRLILSCPNMGYWRYRLYYLYNGKLPDTEWTGHKPWAWSHIRFFNLNILELFMKEAGFKKINKVVGVSERRLDKPLISWQPAIFGMIIVLEII